MPCHTTTLLCPVVIEVPTLKVSFRRKASAKSVNKTNPSLQLGMNAVLEVPEKCVFSFWPLGIL
jgi:hypothetical protein